MTTEPVHGQKALAESFRGTGWHQFFRLVDFYFDRGGSRFPREIARSLSYMSDEWSVEMRYLAGEGSYREAERFLRSAELILEWIKGRL